MKTRNIELLRVWEKNVSISFDKKAATYEIRVRARKSLIAGVEKVGGLVIGEMPPGTDWDLNMCKLSIHVWELSTKHFWSYFCIGFVRRGNYSKPLFSEGGKINQAIIQ